MRHLVLPRQIGHTYTAINGVIHNKKAILIVINQQHARIIENEYPELRGRVRTLNCSSLRSSNSPVVFDHEVAVKTHNEKILLCEDIVYLKTKVSNLENELRDRNEKLKYVEHNNEMLNRSWLNRFIQWIKK